MKTHTQYPYPITNVEQFSYVIKHNLPFSEGIDGMRRIFGSPDERPIFFDDCFDGMYVQSKTLDELEVGDVVVIDGEDYLCEVNNTKWFQKLLTSKATTFPHPLPIDLFPILNKE